MNAARSTILLADDEPNDVFLMRRAFKRAGVFDVQVVCDGEQAIAYLQGVGAYGDREQFPFPGLLLLDIKMPRQNGLEVLAWIRSQPPPIKRLPVLMLTSSKQPHDINTAYDLGANSYLVKPVTFEKLLEVVKALECYWLTFSQHPELLNR
jgi:CheY-like chemotaxis protein